MKRPSLLAIAAAFLASPLYASHSWSNYHWARTTASFNLIVVNSTTDGWDPYVSLVVSDWSQSTVVTLDQHTNGDTSSKTRRHCQAPEGQVRICNLGYGPTGWLGIAGINLDANGHIVKGYTKLNDTYFSSSAYNDPVWKQAVTCQELGHDLGLDHQDEDFYNAPLDTCMDYRDPPWAYPNTHDYDELKIIYGHLDSYDSYDTGSSGAPSGDGSGGGSCNAPPGKGCNKQDGGNFRGQSEWGISQGRHGQTEKFERVNPDGTRTVTFVTWAIGY